MENYQVFINKSLAVHDESRVQDRREVAQGGQLGRGGHQYHQLPRMLAEGYPHDGMRHLHGENSTKIVYSEILGKLVFIR